MPDKLTFKLPEFEGPLDLILHLIARHKLTIYNIEISELLRQYMAYMELLQQQNLDIASEFLEMASRLVHIKTELLLPRHEEPGDDPKAELTGRLLEYAACKRAAGLLRQRDRGQVLFVREPMRMEADKTYTGTQPKGDLILAYNLAMGRGRRRLPPPRSAFSGIVARRIVPVEARVPFVLGRLYRYGQAQFQSLFDDAEERSELVATFLAVLQLVKDRRIRVDDSGMVSLTAMPVGQIGGHEHD